MVAATETPVNALAAGRASGISRARYAEMWVAGVSVGGALARVAQKALIDAARAILYADDFSALAPIGEEVDRLLAKGSA